MLNAIQPSAGKLLISEPFMDDPNFKRSVVFLVEHQSPGSLGFILNRRGNYVLSDLIPDLWMADFPVFIGGPVELDTIHFIHRCYDKLNSGQEICDGVYWGGDFETLKLLINSNQLREDEIKFFVGYAGWDGAQIQNEMEQNTWLVAEKPNNDLLFSSNTDGLWQQVVRSLGPRYAHISNFPTDPNLN